MIQNGEKEEEEKLNRDHYDDDEEHLDDRSNIETSEKIQILSQSIINDRPLSNNEISNAIIQLLEIDDNDDDGNRSEVLNKRASFDLEEESNAIFSTHPH